ncbi:SpoIIE family protein phosphatase [Anaerovoracaceae bacterium 42-11]
MEFIGNQIHVKTILATLTVAFFLGRIRLFGDTFPAAIALIAVMVAVSTVYIYLVPVLVAAILTNPGAGGDFYGDIIAVFLCGLFFLFFHKIKFSIHQRAAAAVIAMAAGNCLYYSAAHILYLLDFQVLLKEAASVMIYIKVFNTAAKMVFVGKEQRAVSTEKAEIALTVLMVSMIGGLEYTLLVIPLWIFMVLVVQYCKGMREAMAAAAVMAVFGFCQGQELETLMAAIMTAVLVSWFLAAFVDGKYRKGILAMVMFFIVCSLCREEIFGLVAVISLFITIPQNLLVKCWCAGEQRFMPEVFSDAEMQIYAAQEDLRRKKQVFTALSKLYSGNQESHQIISYQFAGMARTVDALLTDLRKRRKGAGEAAHVQPVLIGEASYAFEKVSGDSSLSFSFGKQKQAIIISDGMGKGSRAAAESNLVVRTLSQLLTAGFDVDLAVKTVNGILMTEHAGDMFATVDLAIIDKVTGRTQIYKMGAASTFVKHEGKVAALKRPAPPVGVVEGVSLSYIDVRLKKGDLLVMVSDGVTDCDRQDTGCRWLMQRLSEIGTRDPGTIAELIINKAAEKYGLRERDDLTVVVAAI